MRYFKYLIAGVFIICISCEKPEVIHIYLNDYEKAYCSFNPGSYWIFQNDSTMVSDSLYSIRTETYWEDGGTELDKTLLEIKYCLIYKTLGINTGLRFYASATRKGGTTIKDGASGSCFFYGDWGVSYQFGDQTILNATKFDSLNVNGQIFHDVFKVLQPSQEVADTAIAYLVKDIGLIKWEVHYQDSIWERWSLLRYHIQ